jgi:hypothetical protein
MPFKDKDQRVRYQQEYGKGWYQAHKEGVIERRKKQQHEIKIWYAEYKKTLCCKICGESHPACLQFHHRDRAGKSFNIGDMARRPTSKKRLINEIAKCDVLCVNCHAKLHWRETHKTDDWEEIIPPEQ